MSTKEMLLEKIAAIEDENLLKELIRFIELETSINNIYQLSEEEDEAITKAMEASDRGEVCSHDEAKKIFDEWFKKK